MISISGVGLLESTLEPYLKNVLGASQMDVGISFLILGAFYVVSNPIAGWVSLVLIRHVGNDRHTDEYARIFCNLVYLEPIGILLSLQVIISRRKYFKKIISTKLTVPCC